jgi:hypothetical protein
MLHALDQLAVVALALGEGGSGLLVAAAIAATSTRRFEVWDIYLVGAAVIVGLAIVIAIALLP